MSEASTFRLNLMRALMGVIVPINSLALCLWALRKETWRSMAMTLPSIFEGKSVFRFDSFFPPKPLN